MTALPGTRGSAARRRCSQGLLALVLLSALVLEAADRCHVCNTLFGAKVYTCRDLWTEATVLVCETCAGSDAVCSVCALPVPANAELLADGRFLCARDAAAVLPDDAAAERLLAEVRREIDRSFARFTVFPSTNLDLGFVDQVDMQQLLKAPLYDRQCVSLLGYTQSERKEDAGWRHTVRLLRGRPRAELIGVYAHELGHAWARENLPGGRRLQREAEEGFCELLACRILGQLGEREQVERLERNRYTRGQLQLFQRADAELEFHAVMQWMRYGEHVVLSEEEPDRIRVLRLPVSAPPAGPPSWMQPGSLRSSPPRKRLVLVGVLGSGASARALVNDVSLGLGETNQVRVGDSNVLVRCAALGTNTVLLEVGEAAQRLELTLGK